MFQKIKKILSIRIDKRWFRKLAIILVVLAAVITIANEAYYWIGDDYDYYSEDFVGSDEDLYSGSCNVAGIMIRGDIVTYLDEDSEYLQTSSEDVDYLVNEAEYKENVKAILIEIDSYGGYPVAAEEIATVLKLSSKPVVALIREGGLSAAYWIATAADRIFASAGSDVGSIGITMSYLDYANQNQTDGLTYNQLSAGKFKDYGDPNKPLTYEERQLLMRDVNILHEIFIKTVATNRNLDIEVVRKLADGSSMLGEMALENGLIDEIGGQYDVDVYIGNLIEEEVEVCW